MAKPKRPRPPKGRKNKDDDDDDDSDSQAVVPSARDTSSKYYHDEVDTFHEAKTASLLAAGVQLQSDDDFTSDNEEVMALDDDDDEEEDDDEESESAESGLEENLPGELLSGLNKKLYRAAASAKAVSQEKDDAEDQESMASDLEERLHDEMPNELAWGQRKKLYYDTDYVASDRKKGVSQEEEEAEANEEEAEAQLVQKRLAGHLDEDDFGLDFLQAFPQKGKPAGQKIEKDLKKMSEKEKLKLLKKESPELLELLEDLKAKLKELEEKLKPLMRMVTAGTIPRGEGSRYIETKNQLYLNYCTNISYYLVLKAKRIPVHGHPVIERLVSYRNLINELEVADQRLSSELDLLLKGGKKNAGSVKKSTPAANIAVSQLQKKNKLSKKAILDVSGKDQEDNSDLDDEAALQYYMAMKNAVQRKRNRAADTVQEHHADIEDFSPDAKRAITYQIAKNKGLTPKRKKIDRNPRVKHREKFRRAKIRRKGQVREVRKEESRYSGELSGIRAGIKKSIKLK